MIVRRCSNASSTICLCEPSHSAAVLFFPVAQGKLACTQSNYETVHLGIHVDLLCPGASSLSFTSMRVLMDQAGAPPPARADVAIAFVAPAGMNEVQSLGPEISQACQSLFTCVVREVLLAMGGYESKEVEGQVMAVFAEPRQAVEWALALQCALLHVSDVDNVYNQTRLQIEIGLVRVSLGCQHCLYAFQADVHHHFCRQLGLQN